MQTVTALPTVYQNITPEIFTEFIKWIDRTPATARTYIINLRQFLAWLRYAGVENPSRCDIIAYRDYLCSEHTAIQLQYDGVGWKYRTDRNGNKITLTCRPNTVNTYMRSVCQFCKWIAGSGHYPENIAENIRLPKVRRDVSRKKALNPSQVQQIESSILNHAAEMITRAEHSEKDSTGRTQRVTEQSKRLFALFLLAVNAGLRVCEISRANVGDFEELNGHFVLSVWGKGHSEPDQQKAIAPEVARAIKDYLRIRSDRPTSQSPLFTATGNRSHGQRLAPTTISKMLKAALINAGYNSDKLTAHSLRHTAGTGAMQLTGNIYATQKYMRHSAPSTTEIYVHTDEETQDRETAQALYNYFHGKTAEQEQGSNEQLRKIAQALQQLCT